MAVDQLGRPWLFRYDDANTILLDSDRYLAGTTAMADALGFGPGPFVDFLEYGILTSNPPRHTNIRRAARYFSGRLARTLEPTIRESCNALIDEFPDVGGVEFTSAFAFRLPVGVIMRILHLPPADEPLIARWSPLQLPTSGSRRVREQTDLANRELRAYAERICAERRARPIEDDIVSELVAAQGRGEMSEDDLWSLLVSLIVAGHETTTGALSLGLATLLRNPAQLRRLRDDPSLCRNAADEILRYEPPVEAAIRVPDEDVVLHGQPVAAGTPIMISITAANRDPRTFGDPETFDVGRGDARQHITFASGIHRCIGAPLAQLEITVALQTLLQRLDSVQLASEPVLAKRAFRGLESLPLEIRCRPRPSHEPRQPS